MKSEFKEFYHPDPKDFEEIKQNAVFIFDACTLLDLYKRQESSRDELLKTIEKLSKKGRVWQPHQFCSEYQLNRQAVIKAEYENYDVITKDIEKYFRDLDKVSMTVSFPKHPFIKIDEVTKKIKNGYQKLKDEHTQKVSSFKNAHRDLSKIDTTRDKLTLCFEGNVGREYSDEELTAKYTEGEVRYKKYKPPGYCDIDKDSDDVTKRKKYGDLIAWYQILDFAADMKCPIVLVTNENKEDWWWVDKKKNKHGPRKELVKEMYARAGVIFHMFDPDDFLVFANDHLKLRVSKKVMTNIRGVKAQTESDPIKTGNIEQSIPLTNSTTETAAPMISETDAGVVNASSPSVESAPAIKTGSLPEIQV